MNPEVQMLTIMVNDDGLLMTVNKSDPGQLYEMYETDSIALQFLIYDEMGLFMSKNDVWMMELNEDRLDVEYLADIMVTDLSDVTSGSLKIEVSDPIQLYDDGTIPLSVFEYTKIQVHRILHCIFDKNDLYGRLTCGIEELRKYILLKLSFHRPLEDITYKIKHTKSVEKAVIRAIEAYIQKFIVLEMESYLLKQDMTYMIRELFTLDMEDMERMYYIIHQFKVGYTTILDNIDANSNNKYTFLNKLLALETKTNTTFRSLNLHHSIVAMEFYNKLYSEQRQNMMDCLSKKHALEYNALIQVYKSL